MKLKETLNQEISIMEIYASKKPSYNYENNDYLFKQDSLLNLDGFDTNKSFNNFYNLIKEYVLERLEQSEVKEYSNQSNYESDLYLSNLTTLDTMSINKEHADIKLIEADNSNYSYLIYKVITNDNEEMTLVFKLKSIIKITSNSYIPNDNYVCNITKSGLNINNYPSFSIDINQLAFIYYDNETYVFNKDLYQKFFKLQTDTFYEASQLIHSNDYIVSDENIITNGNAKMIVEYYQKIESFLDEIKNETITKDNVTKTISLLNLDLEYSNDKFIIRTPHDLIDLLLLSSGCLGYNNLTNSIFKVKKPQYLDEDFN